MTHNMKKSTEQREPPKSGKETSFSPTVSEIERKERRVPFW